MKRQMIILETKILTRKKALIMKITKSMMTKMSKIINVESEMKEELVYSYEDLSSG